MRLVFFTLGVYTPYTFYALADWHYGCWEQHNALAMYLPPNEGFRTLNSCCKKRDSGMEYAGYLDECVVSFGYRLIELCRENSKAIPNDSLPMDVKTVIIDFTTPPRSRSNPSSVSSIQTHHHPFHIPDPPPLSQCPLPVISPLLSPSRISPIETPISFPRFPISLNSHNHPLISNSHVRTFLLWSSQCMMDGIRMRL